MLGQFVSHVLLDHFCSEDTYQALKSSSRPKFLNIGLKIASQLLETLRERETNNSISQKVLLQLICPKFMKIFVKNYQNSKSQLNDAATLFKSVLLSLVQRLDFNSAQSQLLISSFFGPNSDTKLSFKRNQDLLKVLAQKIEKAELSSMLNSLESEFENPNLSKHFAAADLNSADEDDADMADSKDAHKRAMV